MKLNLNRRASAKAAALHLSKLISFEEMAFDNVSIHKIVKNPREELASVCFFF